MQVALPAARVLRGIQVRVVEQLATRSRRQGVITAQAASTWALAVKITVMWSVARVALAQVATIRVAAARAWAHAQRALLITT